VSVTLDTYSHVAPSLQREAAGRIDESLANRSRLGGGEAELRPECSDGSCGC
jgi:hypothetical protein